MVENIKEISSIADYDSYTDDMFYDADKLQEKIEKMECAREEKVDNALISLFKKLEVMKAQYSTANGVHRVFECIKQYDTNASVFGASTVCLDVVITIENMLAKLDDHISCFKEYGSVKIIDDLESFCEEFYDHNFVDTMITRTDGNASNLSRSCSLAYEIVILTICQSVGGAAQDIAEFVISANEEIVSAKEDLEAINNEIACVDED